jgi:hypothetical protein
MSDPHTAQKINGIALVLCKIPITATFHDFHNMEVLPPYLR